MSGDGEKAKNAGREYGELVYTLVNNILSEQNKNPGFPAIVAEKEGCWVDAMPTGDSLEAVLAGSADAKKLNGFCGIKPPSKVDNFETLESFLFGYNSYKEEIKQKVKEAAEGMREQAKDKADEKDPICIAAKLVEKYALAPFEFAEKNGITALLAQVNRRIAELKNK